MSIIEQAKSLQVNKFSLPKLKLEALDEDPVLLAVERNGRDGLDCCDGIAGMNPVGDLWD